MLTNIFILWKWHWCVSDSEWKWRVMILQLRGLEWIGGYSKSRNQTAVEGLRVVPGLLLRSVLISCTRKFASGRGFSRTHSPSLEIPAPVDLPGKMHYFPEVKQRWQKVTLGNTGGAVSTFSFFHSGLTPCQDKKEKNWKGVELKPLQLPSKSKCGGNINDKLSWEQFAWDGKQYKKKPKKKPPLFP